MSSESNQPSDLKAILDLKWRLDNCAPEHRPPLWRKYLEEIKIAAAKGGVASERLEQAINVRYLSYRAERARSEERQHQGLIKSPEPPGL